MVRRLPPRIQALLQRKSGRDPSSQFPSKIRALLDYSTNNPSLKSEILLAWVDEDLFRMSNGFLRL
jgi:hypothetical protein